MFDDSDGRRLNFSGFRSFLTSTNYICTNPPLFSDFRDPKIQIEFKQQQLRTGHRANQEAKTRGHDYGRKEIGGQGAELARSAGREHASRVG